MVWRIRSASIQVHAISALDHLIGARYGDGRGRTWDHPPAVPMLAVIKPDIVVCWISVLQSPVLVAVHGDTEYETILPEFRLALRRAGAPWARNARDSPVVAQRIFPLQRIFPGLGPRPGAREFRLNLTVGAAVCRGPSPSEQRRLRGRGQQRG